MKEHYVLLGLIGYSFQPLIAIEALMALYSTDARSGFSASKVKTYIVPSAILLKWKIKEKTRVLKTAK